MDLRSQILQELRDETRKEEDLIKQYQDKKSAIVHKSVTGMIAKDQIEQLEQKIAKIETDGKWKREMLSKYK